MTTPRRLLPVLLAALVAGCAGPADPAPSLVDETRTLDEGQILEVNLAMNASASVRAAYEADGTVAWDVHSHRDGDVRVHEEGAARDGTVAFQAPEAGEYSLMWENRGEDPVELSVTVRGDARVVSVVP